MNLISRHDTHPYNIDYIYKVNMQVNVLKDGS